MQSQLILGFFFCFPMFKIKIMMIYWRKYNYLTGRKHFRLDSWRNLEYGVGNIPLFI